MMELPVGPRATSSKCSPNRTPQVAGAVFRKLPDNGLARTLPMGWGSFNKFGLTVDDKLIREVADALVTTGMHDAVYVYLEIDDGWQGDGSLTLPFRVSSVMHTSPGQMNLRHPHRSRATNGILTITAYLLFGRRNQ